jgi:hypothetical protein
MKPIGTQGDYIKMFQSKLKEKDIKITKSSLSNKRYDCINRIFNLIDTLPESTRTDVLKKLISTNITKVLQELVIDLPNKELEHLHEELEKSHLGMRVHPRKGCVLTADYYFEDLPYCDFVKDISEGGAFIYTQADFEKEDEIELCFYWPETEIPIKFTGEVVRCNESGVGTQFIKQNRYQKDILKSLLAKLN